jgi:hypothetical protein
MITSGRTSRSIRSGMRRSRVDPCERVRLTGTIEVPLAPEEGFALFTPSGERAWSEGWDPEFPSPVADEIEPGTVFTTGGHGDQRTTWTVVRREGHHALAYSRTTPGERAGLVTVTLQPSAVGSTVTVDYDLTALVPAANAELRSFATHYRHFLDGWQDSIARCVAHPPTFRGPS